MTEKKIPTWYSIHTIVFDFDGVLYPSTAVGFSDFKMKELKKLENEKKNLC